LKLRPAFNDTGVARDDHACCNVSVEFRPAFRS
jgi:hypothetical protein